MSVTVEDIAAYLADVSEAVGSDRFRIELNDNRQDNRQLFFDYILSESDAKKIRQGKSAKPKRMKSAIEEWLTPESEKKAKKSKSGKTSKKTEVSKLLLL
jgi:hypothetical protein